MVSDTVIVVPTIREASIRQFLAAWHFPCDIIVVEDNPEPTFDLDGCTHYCWQDIERDLGADSWVIPRRTDCIRSYGYWKAWQAGVQVIITLDDDCLPVYDDDVFPGGNFQSTRFIASHLDNLKPHPVVRWHSTLAGDYPRGYPYEQSSTLMPVGISHGLWQGTLDYDSISQLHYGRTSAPLTMPYEGVIPTGKYYPMCGMNLAWQREYTPLMYFLLMGQNAQGALYPYDRFGDIWAGILSKKVLDHLGVGVWTGGPLVNHSRASNVWANFDKEHAGIRHNEDFWRMVDAVPLTAQTVGACYQQIAAYEFAERPYGATLSRAMQTWAALYE